MTESAEFDRKLAAALAELRATGMWRANFDPHMDRALRRLGLRLRPPHYRSFLPYMFGMGRCFAIGWGILMLLMPHEGARSILGVSIGALVGGAVWLWRYLPSIRKNPRMRRVLFKEISMLIAAPLALAACFGAMNGWSVAEMIWVWMFMIGLLGNVTFPMALARRHGTSALANLTLLIGAGIGAMIFVHARKNNDKPPTCMRRF
ncbi:DUF6404 family protein [Roseinatronobacter sp. NSM]|uniref:DUF6404 family protein n=1 Tax=Roseinatronobacter sp. NSM TaxID=3457785 RepID=UPI004036F613